MAKNKHRGGTATSDPEALQARVERLLAEQKFQHGLELARTLHRVIPGPHSVHLLVRAAFGRARQLTATNHAGDAASVLASVAAFVQSPEQIEELALALAECGQFDLAMRVAKPLASPDFQGRILGDMADAAMRGRAVPTNGLPPDFLAQRDLIVKAFAEAEAGRDDEARAALQAIGLASPFLEWKLLLRGLMAYYQSDDAKALENWQRLNPRRVPARLAAPLRQAIDPAFRQSQSQETQQRLQNVFDLWHRGSTLQPRMRQIQLAIADPDSLADAFRKAESLLPALKAEAPALVARLATCFYWAIIEHGYPEDLRRYQRVFGDPREDPGLNRLQALAVERRGEMDIAIAAWKDYEKAIAKNAAAFPPGHADRIRALVWHRIAVDAMQMEEDRDLLAFGDFADGQAGGPTDPESCFKRSLELAPDQLDVHFAFVQYYLEEDKLGKALQAAKRLLKQFPEHVPTLELAGSLSLRKGNFREAIDFYRAAVQANPLNAKLRSMLGLAHSGRGLELSGEGKTKEARAEFQVAITFCEGDSQTPMLCGWACMEFKSGDPAQAEEILRKSAAIAGNQLATAFIMLIMTITKKLGKAFKTRFEAEAKRLLSEPPTAASARNLAVNFAAMNGGGAKYVGQKTHQKMVLAYLDKALKAEFSESQLADVCAAVSELDARPLLRKYFDLGKRRFPANPQFYLAELDYHLGQAPSRRPRGTVRYLVERLRSMATALPPDQRAALLEKLEEREGELRDSFPFGGLFPGRDGDDFWPGDDFEDDEDGEDDWEE